MILNFQNQEREVCFNLYIALFSL